MRTDMSYTLRIGGIVLVAALVGIGAFLYFGSEIGVYAVLVGIPAIVIGAAVVYARQSTPSASKQTSKFFERKGQRVGEDARSLLTTYDKLRSTLTTWDPEGLDGEVDYLIDRLADAGVRVDRETTRYEVVGEGDVRELERLEEDVDDLRVELSDAVSRHVDRDRDACLDAQERLRDANLIAEIRNPDPPSSEDVADLIDAVERHREAMIDAIDEAVHELETIAATNDYAVAPIERGDERARDAVDDGSYDGVADALLDARSELERGLSQEFQDTRREMESFIDTVESSVVDDYVRPRLLDDLVEIKDDLTAVDSALDLADVERLTGRTRDLCTEMVTSMSDDLDDALRTLAEADVPSSYYDHQPAADDAFVRQLEATDDLSSYRSQWLNAVGELSSALDDVEEKADVAEAYDVVEEDITEALRRQGRVEPDDLRGMKMGEEFLELYAEANPEVEYEPTIPALIAEEFGESYDVSIQAGFPAGGPKRRVTVDLDGAAGPHDAEFETHLLDVVTFEDVPHGEYTLTVTTGADGFGEVERDLTVDDDREVEVTLPEIELREEVCADVESDARAALPDAAPLFADRYEEEEYLSADMGFPMNDEYVPCLLALWAEDQGMTARRVDGRVLVYDGGQFESRLTNIVEHNLSSGEAIPYTEIRNRYLAVPASDDLIAKTLESSDVASAVDCEPQRILKR